MNVDNSANQNSQPTSAAKKRIAKITIIEIAFMVIFLLMLNDMLGIEFMYFSNYGYYIPIRFIISVLSIVALIIHIFIFWGSKYNGRRFALFVFSFIYFLLFFFSIRWERIDGVVDFLTAFERTSYFGKTYEDLIEAADNSIPNEPQQAMIYIERALSVREYDYRPWLVRGNIYALKGDQDKALADYREAETLFIDTDEDDRKHPYEYADSEIYLQTALIYVSKNQYDSAYHYYAKIKNFWAQNVFNYPRRNMETLLEGGLKHMVGNKLLAGIKKRGKFYKNLEVQYTRTIDPQKPEKTSRNSLAKKYTLQGIWELEKNKPDKQAAVKLFTKAILADSTYVVAYYNRAVAYSLMDSIHLFEQVSTSFWKDNLNKDSTTATEFYCTGIVKENSNHLYNAEKIAPKRSDIRLASLYLRHTEYSGSNHSNKKTEEYMKYRLEDIDELLQLDTLGIDANLVKAHFFYSQQLYTDAHFYYAKVLHIDSTNQYGLLNQGIIYQLEGNTAEAKKYLSKCLLYAKDKSTIYHANYSLAIVAYEQNDYELALAYVNKSIAARSLKMYYTLIYLTYTKESYVKESIAARPLMMYYQLRMLIYLNLNNTKEACADLQKLIEYKDPQADFFRCLCPELGSYTPEN